MKREDLSEFDSITDLGEAKRCLKITYRKYENCHEGARFFMLCTLALLAALVGVLYYV